MGVEERRNGNVYYYRKRREGDRVVSEYVGAGSVASLVEYQEKHDRLRRDAAQLRDKRARARIEDLDRQIDELGEAVDLLATADLLAKGYHRHKRQWRRRR